MTSKLDEADGARVLREAVETLEIPPLSANTLDTILARRARGERVVLRTGDPLTSGRVRSVRLVMALLAGAAALIIAAVVVQRDVSMEDEDIPNHAALAAVDSACASAPTTTRDSSVLRHLMISAFGVPAACGAEPPRDGPIAYNASQVRTGTFTYRMKTVTDSAFTSVHAPSTVTVSRTTWKGAPAFLAVRQGPPNTGLHLDSLVVSANGPAPLYFVSWYMTQRPPGSIRAEFDSASVRIAMSRLDTVATMPFHMNVGELPYGFASVFSVPALPLAQGWHGAIEIAPPMHPRAYRFFKKAPETMRLRVVARETIRVPAGSFDCWKLQAGSPEDRSFMWVSTANHLMIRSTSLTHFDDTSFEDTEELERVKFDAP